MSNEHNNQTIRLATADDHTIVRTGLQMMLELKFGITNIYEASSCAETLSVIRKYKPTHLITDMMFKDGNVIEILPTIRNLMPDLHIMVYSMLPTEVYLPALQRFGITSYMHKEYSQEQIMDSVQRFLYYHSNRAAPAANEDIPQNPFSTLSTRELEVLHYILKGESSSYAAKALNLHKSTIGTLKSRILEKTGVKNMKGLLDMAALHNYNT